MERVDAGWSAPSIGGLRGTQPPVHLAIALPKRARCVYPVPRHPQRFGWGQRELHAHGAHAPPESKSGASTGSAMPPPELPVERLLSCCDGYLTAVQYESYQAICSVFAAQATPLKGCRQIGTHQRTYSSEPRPLHLSPCKWAGFWKLSRAVGQGQDARKLALTR